MAIEPIEVLSAITQFAAVIGIFLLYLQIKLSRKATESQLINELEKEFSNYYPVLAKIKPGGAWYSRAELNSEEIAQLENLAAFCEKLKHFHDRGILDWETLDLMFRNRFFLIMHNVNVLKLVIEPFWYDWQAVLKLESKWIERLPKLDPRWRTRTELL
jgi:hypothetical protein